MEEISFILDLCVKYKIDYIIGGHDHRRNESVNGNTNFIILDQCHDNEKNSSYLEVKYDSNHAAMFITHSGVRSTYRYKHLSAIISIIIF